MLHNTHQHSRETFASTYIERRLGIQPHKSLASSQGFGTTRVRLAATPAAPEEALVSGGVLTTPRVALDKEHSMAYLLDKTDSNPPEGAVEAHPVELLLSTVEEEEDRGIVMPACILAISRRSLVSILIAISCFSGFFVWSLVGCK